MISGRRPEFVEGLFKRSTLERGTIEGNSPVFKKHFMLLAIFLKYLGKRQP